MKNYEVLFILDPVMDDEAKNAMIERVKEISMMVEKPERLISGAIKSSHMRSTKRKTATMLLSSSRQIPICQKSLTEDLEFLTAL